MTSCVGAIIFLFFFYINDRLENDSIKNWNFKKNPTGLNSTISQKHVQVLLTNVYLRPRHIPKSNCLQKSAKKQ